MSFRRLLLILVLLACSLVGLAGPSGASNAPIELDREPTPEEWDAGLVACSLTVIGREQDGRLITLPMKCKLAAPKASLLESDAVSDGPGSWSFASWGVIATHYDGFFSGSYIQIWGDVCNGGWLNLTSSWINRISTTSSYCWAEHYDGYNLTGALEGGSILSYMDNRPNSIVYY